MKEFAVYTGLRAVLLVATFGVVIGVWDAVAGDPNLFLAIVIAFAVSGVGSWFVLQRPRAAFADRVETRAARMTSSIEAMRAKEDDLDGSASSPAPVVPSDPAAARRRPAPPS